MKGILRFLSLLVNVYGTYIYRSYTSIHNYLKQDFINRVFKGIMPVKSQRFNTKIYIFERYSTFNPYSTYLNGLSFSPSKKELVPVIQKY